MAIHSNSGYYLVFAELLSAFSSEPQSGGHTPFCKVLVFLQGLSPLVFSNESTAWDSHARASPVRRSSRSACLQQGVELPPSLHLPDVAVAGISFISTFGSALSRYRELVWSFPALSLANHRRNYGQEKLRTITPLRVTELVGRGRRNQHSNSCLPMIPD